MAHLFGPATKKLTGCIVIQQVCFQNLFKVFVHRFLIGSSLADCPSPLADEVASICWAVAATKSRQRSAGCA